MLCTLKQATRAFTCLGEKMQAVAPPTWSDAASPVELPKFKVGNDESNKVGLKREERYGGTGIKPTCKL